MKHAQLLGEGAAVQIEVVGQLLPVEWDLELQTAAAGGLCGKVGQQTAPHGLGGGAEDALRKAQVFAHGHREQVAQQLFVHRAGRTAGKGGNVYEQHFAFLGGHGVHHHHVAAQRVGLGKGLPGRNAAQDALTAPQVEIFDVDGAAQHHAQSMHWKFVWVKAGLASLTTNATTYHSQPAYRINLLALGSKRADFFFKMRDTLTCVIGEKLEPRYFRKGAEEGKRYTVDEAWFSYKDGLCLVNQKRTYRDGAFDESEASDSRCIYDMLSILAQARSYDPADYKVGDKIKFPMATGRKVEEQTLIYRGKENVKAENGVTYRCLIFSLVEYDKKGKEKEVITFFVTDDLNHLPVRLDLFLNFGSAKAFLNNVTGNRHPLTSIVK